MKQNKVCGHTYLLYMIQYYYANHTSSVENWINKSPLHIPCELRGQSHQHSLMLTEILDKFSPSLDSKAGLGEQGEPFQGGQLNKLLYWKYLYTKAWNPGMNRS